MVDSRLWVFKYTRKGIIERTIVPNGARKFWTGVQRNRLLMHIRVHIHENKTKQRNMWTLLILGNWLSSKRLFVWRSLHHGYTTITTILISIIIVNATVTAFRKSSFVILLISLWHSWFSFHMSKSNLIRLLSLSSQYFIVEFEDTYPLSESLIHLVSQPDKNQPVYQYIFHIPFLLWSLFIFQFFNTNNTPLLLLLLLILFRF